MKRTLLVLAIVCCTLLDHIDGQIDNANLKTQSHLTDSSAHAAYLVHKAWTYFDYDINQGYSIVTKYEDIIKIYDEQGEYMANFEIPIWRDGSEREDLFEVKGTTYNDENGKIIKTKLQKSDIFEVEKTDKLQLSKWAMPNVRAGSIIEVSYAIRSPFIYTIPRFDFQKEIPIDLVTYRVQMPVSLTYIPISTGKVTIERSEERVNGKNSLENVYTFKASNVKAMKDDDYVLDIDDYRGSLKYEIYQAHFSNQPVKNYSKSWKDIAENLMDHPSFGKQISKKNSEFEKFIGSFANASKLEKIQAAYSKIQNDYVWNKDYGRYTDEGTKKLSKNGSGNIADINLTLISLLRQMGVETYPLCLKSRWNGVLNPYFPSVSELDYVLAYVPLDDESYLLLDATSKKIPLGQLPTRAVNLNGLLVGENVGEIIASKNPNLFDYTELNKYAIDIDNTALIGGGKMLRKNYAATKYRLDMESNEIDEVKDQDEDGTEEDPKINIENEIKIVEVKGVENINDKITVSVEERLFNVVDIIDDKIFLNATLDFGMTNNPFFEENREFPIFYNYLQMNKYVTTVEIPSGYKLESVPQPISISLEDKSVLFRYDIVDMGDKFNINYVFEVKNDVISPEYYSDLKEVYSRIIAISKQKIVLSKI